MITKVIIADVSKDFRKALIELLKEVYAIESKGTGIEEIMEEANNGLELLQKIKKNKPDLIFMDIEMPYMNGFEATKNVVSLYPDIKIIGMSRYEKESYIQRLIDVGAHGYLIKSEDNYEAIKELIAGKTDSFIFSSKINHHLPLSKSYKTILFVDKTEDKNLDIRHFLRKHGYTVLKAQNTAESIFFLNSNNIDTVIIDKSIINRNSNFLSTVAHTTKSMNFILINGNNIKAEIKNKHNHKIRQLEKGFSPELLVKTIEEC